MNVNELIEALTELPEEDKAKKVVNYNYDEVTEVRLLSLADDNDAILID